MRCSRVSRPVFAALLCAALLPSLARSSGPVGTDGVWAEQHPLAAAAHGAIVDPVFDRMVVLREQPEANGVGRMSVWSLPLHGTPVWHRDDLTVPADLNTANSFRNAVYDPKRHRLMVVVLNATITEMTVWALPLRAPYAWQQVATAGTPPSLRFEAGLVVDAARDRLVLYGGADVKTFQTLNDSWSLPLAGTPTWTPITPTGPLAPGASRPAIALDAAGDRMITLCSAAPYLPGQQTWALSLGATPAWTRLDADGDTLAPNYGFSQFGIDPVTSRLLAFDESLRRVVELPLAGGAWAEAATMPSSVGLAASVVRDAARNRFLVHGGYLSSWQYANLAETWAYADPGDWALVNAHPFEPPPRSAATAAVDFTRGRLVMHGGAMTYGMVLGDTWTLSFGDLSWTQLAPQGDVPFRSGHASAYDPIQDRMFVIGGMPEYFVPESLDVWQLVFTTEPPTWTRLHPLGTPPSARIGFSLAYDLARNRLVLHGGTGFAGEGVFDELWALELTGTPTWHALVPAAGPRPGALASALMAADPPRARLVLFGGLDDSGSYHDETWALENDGVDDRWVRIGEALTAPGGRQQSAMVYDPILDRMLVHGGYGEVTDPFPNVLSLNDTWELPLSGPGGWRQLDSGGDIPRRRELHVMGFDGLHDRLVVTTGTSGSSRDVWTLSFSPPVEDVPPGPAPLAPSALALAPLRNPCAGALDLRLALPSRGRVTLEVFDVSGRRVIARDLGEQDAGARVVRLLEPRAVAPGLYLVRAQHASRATTAKVLITH